METWREIPGFPGYEVSDMGRVRHTTYLKPFRMPHGHLKISLGRGKKRLIHRLVLEAFVGPAPAGTEGCHYPDHNPGNNALANLRWDTRKANVADMVRAGRARGGRKRGECHANARFTDADIRDMRSMRDGGALLSDIATKYKSTKSAVSDIVRRKAWKHVDG